MEAAPLNFADGHPLDYVWPPMRSFDALLPRTVAPSATAAPSSAGIAQPNADTPVHHHPHEPLTDPRQVGVDPLALRKVVEQFRAQQAQGRFPAGQLAVRRHGRLLVDEAAGFARGGVPLSSRVSAPCVPATPTTPFIVYSAGKPLIAMAVALLEERGQLDVHAPIAEVFPEFGRRGKGHITTLDVLTHRGGILMPEFIRRVSEWTDWNRVVDAICAVRPTYPRGVLAYHPLEYGWVLAEVVRRVAGCPLPQFLERELTGPAGLRGLRFGITPDEVARLAQSHWLGPRSVKLAQVNMAALFAEVNALPELFTAFIPGAGLVTDAAHLAAFYDLLASGFVARDGRTLLSADTIRRYTARHAFGFDRTNRVPLAVGRGFLLGTQGPSVYGWWNSSAVFGHAGAFCTVAFADQRTGLAAAFVTNGNHSPREMVGRFPGILGRLRSAAN